MSCSVVIGIGSSLLLWCGPGQSWKIDRRQLVDRNEEHAHGTLTLEGLNDHRNGGKYEKQQVDVVLPQVPMPQQQDQQ
jgi:hypothetical protein